MSAPKATRVHTEHGSHIEPPLKQHWGNLHKLRWHAAVTALDAGVQFDIQPSSSKVRVAGIWLPMLGRYEAIYDNGVFDCGDFLAAWSFINGLGLGAQLAKKATR